MPLSYKQLGNTFIQGPNISIYPSGNSYVISGNAPNTDSFGFTFVNSFFGVAYSPIDGTQDLTGPNSVMQYKSFSAGTGIGIIDSNNTLIFTAATSTVNGLTSFTSAGTGNILLLSSITNNNLIYKSLSGTSNLSINDDNNGTLIFSLAGGGTGTIISGVNIGTGINVFTGLSTTTNANDTLAFRNLLAGDNITVALSSTNDGDILISRGSPTLVNQLSSIGGGSRVLSAISTTNLLIARTLLGASGFTLSNPASPTIALVAPTNTTASRFYVSDATSQLTTSAFFGSDSTTGSLGIGGGATTNTRLLFGVGSASISQIRFTAFSGTVTSPTDGDIWYSTSGNTLKFYKNNISTDFIFKDNNISLTGLTDQILLVSTAGTITPRYVNSFGVYEALSSVTVQNTAVETSIISSVLTGSTTLLASTNAYNPELGVGRKFRFIARGTIQTDNTSVDNLTVNLKISSTTIATSSAFLVNQGTAANTYFEIEATFTVRNSGIVVCNGKVIGGSNITRTPSKIINGIYSQNATISTTINQIFDCTVKFDQANANNIIVINQSGLEILN
jgi:hypothetical protein